MNRGIAIAVLLTLTGSRPAQSARFDGTHVTDRAVARHVPSEYATIQAALDACEAGDSVLVAPGTYAGLGNQGLALPPFDVLLLGTAGSDSTIIECWSYHRGFEVTAGQTPNAVIAGFTVVGGDAWNAPGGGLLVESSAPTLRDLRFLDCSSTSSGGAMFIRNAQGMLLEDIRCDSCRAAAEGGALTLFDSDVVIDGLLATGNRGFDAGGALYSRGSTMTLRGSSLLGNTTDGEGGAIYLDGGTLLLEKCLVAYNSGVGGVVGSNVSQFQSSCSDAWSNIGGNYAGDLADPTGMDGNFDVDPLVSDLGTGDWSLHPNSPCLPANNACGTRIGYLGEGPSGTLLRLAGVARDRNGIGLSSVRFDGLAGAFETDEDGHYGVWLPSGWSGTLTPSLPHYVITPSERDYVDLEIDLTSEDYQGANPTLVRFPSDFDDLQVAVDFADAGDTVLVLPGDYDLPTDMFGYGGLQLGDEDIALVSLGGPAVTVLHTGLVGIRTFGGPGTRISGLTIRDCTVGLICGAGSSARLDNLVIESCGTDLYAISAQGMGLGCYSGANPLVSNVTFRDNVAISEASQRGAAVYCAPGAAPTFITCRFEGNGAVEGGAIWLQDASPTFINSVFASNWAEPYTDPWNERAGRGGAVYCSGGDPGFQYCVFAGNEARIGEQAGDVYGGAFYLTGPAAPSLQNCSFAGNSALAEGHLAQGGAFYLNANTAASLASCIVAFGAGGGGFFSPAPETLLSLSCCDVVENVGGDFIGVTDPTGSDGNFAADPHFCDLSGEDLHLAADSPCLPDGNSCGVQLGALGEGCTATTAPEPDAAPAAVVLRNHPNPFNPSTAIQFGLPGQACATLRIFDAEGRAVATPLRSVTLSAGFHTVTWEGRDDTGRPLPSGVYLLRLETSLGTSTRKATLLK